MSQPCAIMSFGYHFHVFFHKISLPISGSKSSQGGCHTTETYDLYQRSRKVGWDLESQMPSVCAQLLTCNRLFSSPEVWVMKWVWPENPRLPPTDICVSMLIAKSILQFCFENYKADSDFSLAGLLLAAQETEIFLLPAGCRFSHSQLRWRCLVGKSFSHPKQQPAANLASELHLEDASPHRGGLWRWELQLPRIYGSIQQKLM